MPNNFDITRIGHLSATKKNGVESRTFFISSSLGKTKPFEA
jgi:hypothetical protein